jgi:hypothetical protein
MNEFSDGVLGKVRRFYKHSARMMKQFTNQKLNLKHQNKDSET